MSDCALPSGWIRVRLADVVSPIRPRVDPQSVGSLPFVGMEHVEAQTMRLLGTVPSNQMRSSGVRFEAGDVLYGRLRPYLNKVYHASFSGLCSAEFIVLPETPAIDSRFLAYRINAADFVAFSSQQNEGDRPRVDFTQIGRFELLLPPLQEQHRIVAALEEHLSALDAAVAGLERARANVHRFIASVLSAAAAGELIDGTAFGEWDAVTLQDVVDPTRKCAYGVLQPGPNVDDGVPLVRVGDVNDGVVSARDLKRISPAIASAYPRTRLRGGELLMTLVGTIGRTAVVPSELAGANVARAIGVIPVGSRARAEWLNIWFRSPAMLSFMNARAHEVARKTLNLEDVRAARVSLPPIDVQDQLVATVERRTDAARRLMGELDTQLARANGLRRSILQSAFSGGLVPQDPADAPASIAPERDLTERSSTPASSRPARGRGRTARTGSRRG